MNSLVFGTQLLGSELDERDSKKILDFALDKKILKFDTAERYPFPESSNTYGSTEKIIGNWLIERKINRNKIEIATKITGRNFGEIKQIYSQRLTRKAILISVDRCLKRLKTNYIDILYLHWPDRFTNNFGRTYYSPENDILYIPLEEQLEALYILKKNGKIRSFGLSNETPWGIMKFINLDSKKKHLSTLQEEYSLLNRNIERSIKEIILREKINFYCYSPLSGGLLTKKYSLSNNKIKDINNSSWRLIKHSKKTGKLHSIDRVIKLKKLAKLCSENNISVMDLSLAFLRNQKFISGVIIGPRNINQLKQLLKSWGKKISTKIINDISTKIG